MSFLAGTNMPMLEVPSGGEMLTTDHAREISIIAREGVELNSICEKPGGHGESRCIDG